MSESDHDTTAAPTTICGKEWANGAYGLHWRCIRPPHPEHPDTHHYRVTTDPDPK